MNALLRPFLFTGFLGVLLVTQLCLRQVGSLGQRSTAEGEGARPDDLEIKRQALVRRHEAKQRIVQALVDGQLTLLGAAARFRDFDSRPPEFSWETFRRVYLGDSDDESHCWEVIAAIPVNWDDPTDRAAETVQRLVAELQGYVDRGEPIRLPALSAE